MKVTALAGGVGGSKFISGLINHLSPNELSIIVNTGDDFEHLGLSISPDLDTVCYTLAGIANPDTGWGQTGESFHALENIRLLGGPDWFLLGDKDLATHIERTRLFQAGFTKTEITRRFSKAWGIDYPIFPMSDDPVRTMVDTIEYGELPFQEYFVHQKCNPTVKGFRFPGIDAANPAPGVVDALSDSDVVIVCPSNPWVSIDPIIKIKNIRSILSSKKTIAISPIVGGKTIKGPAAKMYAELGIEPSAYVVARHYQDILNGFVLDEIDSKQSDKILTMGIKPLITQTIMKTLPDRARLAEDVLNFANQL